MRTKYLTIYNEIVEKMEAGIYKPNSLLASEHE